MPTLTTVDMVLTDPPYGTTACKWDSIIPLDEMWQCVNQLVDHGSVIGLFCNEPFTSVLITSNLKGFKYRVDWDKKIPSGMPYARFRPMQQIEDIAIFSKGGGKTKYNPQLLKRDAPIKAGGNNIKTDVYSGFKDIGKKDYKKTYNYKQPTNLIRFNKIRRGSIHPTQKPVALMEYLIKTYTNEGDTVLDFTMGSGTTGVACINTGRKFIGIELDKDYFDISVKRINEALHNVN